MTDLTAIPTTVSDGNYQYTLHAVQRTTERYISRSETMSKREKRLEKARNNPKNVTFEELVTLLESYGFQKAHGEGSHVTYWYNQGGLALPITIVYRRPHVKPVYVKEVIEKIDPVKEQAGE